MGSRPPRRRSLREPLPAPRPSGACLAHVDALSVSVLHHEHPHPGSSPPSASPPCPLGLCACHSPHTHHPPSSCPRANCPSAAPTAPHLFWERLESGDVRRLPLWASWARTERGQSSLRICACSITDFERMRTLGPWLQRRCSWPRGRCYALWLPPGGRRVALLAGEWARRSSQRGQDSPCDGRPERARLPHVFLIRITTVYTTWGVKTQLVFVNGLMQHLPRCKRYAST